MLPRIAFCTTIKNRLQHIRRTLPANISGNIDYSNCVFTIINLGSNDGFLEYIKENHQPDIESGRLVVCSLLDERGDLYSGPFLMATAKNIAHRLGLINGASHLCNLDADNFTGKGFARYVATMFDLYGPKTFLWGKMVQGCYKDLDGDACVLPRNHEIKCTASNEILEWIYQENERPHARGISGRLVVTRDAFLKSGGYNEPAFDRYGPDDRDLNLRIQRLGYMPREINGRYLNAIPHSEKVRFKEYPHWQNLSSEEWYAFEATAGGSVHTAVANFGKIGVCNAVDLNGNVIKIPHHPTRIFGCGMHKTGTTSLYKALETLGYDSAHWVTPRWARNIWEELLAYGKSLTLEKHEALTDFPIGLMYQEIDHAYPGSKFILTLRDEGQWLRSVEAHFGPQNPWRADWDNDAFTHRLHHEVYGRKRFDAEVMLTRYRRHNAEVQEYFKDRHSDLLVLNLNENDPWRKLCDFLGKPMPTAPYPLENKSEV